MLNPVPIVKLVSKGPAAALITVCKLLYAPINAVVELTASVVAGSVNVTEVPTAPGPCSTIVNISSTQSLTKVPAPADPAVSKYRGTVVCNGANDAPVATCAILTDRNPIVPNVASLIDAGI